MSFALLVSSVDYFFLFCDIPDCPALEDIQYSRSRTESNPWLAPFHLPSPAEEPPVWLDYAIPTRYLSILLLFSLTGASSDAPSCRRDPILELTRSEGRR